MTKLQLPNSVTVVAVTKGRSVKEILLVLRRYNLTNIGESKWQEAEPKLQHIPVGVKKHFIGHLQTNKVKYIVPSFDCIQSVDSLKLAQAISKSAVAFGKVVEVYLQVNVSNAVSKHGYIVSELTEAVRQVSIMPGVRLIGLMAITAKQTLEKTRQDFRTMKQLQLQHALPELSMGMSSDWQVAAAEGATVIRLGSTLFD